MLKGAKGAKKKIKAQLATVKVNDIFFGYRKVTYL